MGDERDMFVGLGWEKEIRSLGDPHVPFNPSPEHDIGAANRYYSDDYKMTPFSQSTQAWRFRVEEEQKRSVKNDKRQADVSEKDADLNENKSIETEEVKVVGESSKSLSYRERMKGLSPHRRPLKDRMRDKTISYVDLLRPGVPPSRRDDEMKSESSRRFAKRK